LARRIVSDILHTCQALGIALCGGHTEITLGLPRTIVVGQMLGIAKKSDLIRKESQRPGDLVILTRGVAVEGTSILARVKGAELQTTVGRGLVNRAKRLVFDPGISVIRDARLAVRSAEIHAMHDPTEGGLLSGLAEVAQAGGAGLRVWKDKIPVLPETLAFSQAMRFNPLALLASGALLVVVTRASASRLLCSYARQGIPAAMIGEIRPPKEGLSIIENGGEMPLRVPKRDEIARLLEGTPTSAE